MNYFRAVAVLASVGPIFAQYGGPAILARGQSPGAASSSQIDFRPFVSVTGNYNHGLNGVSVDANGAPVNDDSYGVSLSFGVSGSHSWKRTQLGLIYSGNYTHYSKSFYDGVNGQNLQLSVTHMLSRHALLSVATAAVYYGSNQATPTLPQIIAFDPATTYIPTNDFFDTRTFSLSSQANLTLQRSARLSYSFGGDAFLTRRRSSALYGGEGAGAHADVQYRLSRRSTIGAGYNFMHYMFTGIAGSTDTHSVIGSYSRILSRSTQFSVFAGVARYENLFVEIVSIDPAIAAVIGISSAQRVSYQAHLTPNIGARISKVVPRGTVFANLSHGINPGNGLFLTSTSTNAGGGYSYTGLRRWSISASANYNESNSEGNVIGNYGSYSGGLAISRQVMRMTHGVLGFSARKYTSGDFKNYNKWSYAVNLGVSFSPGDIPIRFW